MKINSNMIGCAVDENTSLRNVYTPFQSRYLSTIFVYILPRTVGIPGRVGPSVKFPIDQKGQQLSKQACPN